MVRVAQLRGIPVNVLPDGSPHTTPLWISTHGEHVYLTSPHSRKVRPLCSTWVVRQDAALVGPSKSSPADDARGAGGW
ncbi:MAG: hypothetical protein ACRDP9_10945 [Kribbellaceae bacterium]